jgi:hypothetical protein
MNSAGSSTGQTGRSGWSRSPGVGRHAPCPRHGLRRRTRRPAVPGNPRRAAQRIGLRPCLALRPRSRPRPRASRQRARPAPLRPAARRLVVVAERRWGPTSRSATSSSHRQLVVRARPWKSQRLHRPTGTDAVRYTCAMRRTVVSPAQRAEMQALPAGIAVGMPSWLIGLPGAESVQEGVDDGGDLAPDLRQVRGAEPEEDGSDEDCDGGVHVESGT